MDRDQLLGALNRSGDVYEAARQALLAGDEFKVWSEAVPVESLRVIYERREAHTRSEEVATLGFADAVNDLHNTPLAALRLGQIAGTAPPRHYQLFLSPDDDVMVACLAVGS